MILQILNFFIYFCLAVLSIVIHEWSHGAVAYLRGDPTAKLMDRLSLNPLKHVDPFGTVILPITLYVISGFTIAFGWAKPVPVNHMYLRYPRFDMILVALAGPLSNFILGFLGYVAVSMLFTATPDYLLIKEAVGFFVFFNIGIGLFNLLPILPLDGGRVLAEILPRSLSYYFYKLERVGILVIFGILVILPQIEKMLDLHIFSLKSFLFASGTTILEIYKAVLDFIIR